MFWARALVYGAVLGDHEDARGVLATGRALLANPLALYPATADVLARGLLPSRTNGASLQPAPVAFLAAPFALVPEPIGVALWVLVELISLVAALLVLERVIRPAGRAVRPTLWLVAGYFPPVFADLFWGQRVGQLMLLAALSMLLIQTRPLVAGVLAGAATSLKFFPAAMAIGAPPGLRLRYAGALAVAAGLLLWLTFIPFGGFGYYLQHVLAPTFASSFSDCGVVSVRGLIMRGVGGEPYPVLGPGDVVLAARSPIHEPQLATWLLYATELAILAAAIWAAWRSEWSPAYGLALGFSLGALVPGEVYTYQWLALLPLLLLVLAKAGEERRWWVLGLIAVALLGFVREPCRLPFPNVWTLAGLAIFGIAVSQSDLFRRWRDNQRR